MNRKQRRIAAKLGTHNVPPSATVGGPAGIPELLSRAVQHHQAGRLVEAEDCYRKILEADENHFHGLHLLGVLAQQAGRSELAERLIGKAIALHDRFAAHYDAASSDLRVPTRVKRAIARRDLAEAHSNLSIVLMALGRPIEALGAIQRSIALEETENTKLLFVQCLGALNSVPADIDVRDNLARALSEPWGRPIDLAKFAANVIKRDGKTGTCIQRFTDAGAGRARRQESVPRAELTEICGDRLLRSALEAAVIFDIELERYLTAARNTMLEMACVSDEPAGCEKDLLRFFCALSRQCYINEYVFARTDRETDLVERLRRLAADALSRGQSIPDLWLIALAAYIPLASLPWANSLARRRWSGPVAQLLSEQLQEAEQERQLRDSMPRLTAIDEKVSLAVKGQYEENPYPRWVKASPVGHQATIAAHLRGEFPNLDLRDLPAKETAEILIAGCGTGQHSIETDRRFKGARVLAIDLSLASLCYAKRKTQELGLKNIQYGQADILRLGATGRKFDVIEAGGVLHHLSDPLTGWRVLLSLLRPGGLMRLGLYSALARKDISAARAFIAQRGYSASAEDIRRCRQELTSSKGNASFAKFTDWGDFFSTSTCRDLLFHVQEHQMSLPEIDDFLRQNALQFLGFVLPNDVRGKYRDRFRNDMAMTDLALWHVFETENPATFTGMYQFWIRKAS
jgi:2-polyprenyl-3-methyl-5-hydroxy-6-metoxy-1,4-benzoquinol methylase